jgi:adenylate cyclase
MAEERVQRRLAAILVADVVGYSRLMGSDEEGTLARLKLLRREVFDPVISHHRGRIVKTTGDGLLVEFTSVIDAVKCAVEIQNRMPQRNGDLPDERRIELRIGVNLGDVIVDGDDIFGDGVNVAARLETLAAPGAVCVSGTVHEHAAGKLTYSFEDLGERQVKNIANPVRAWQFKPDNVPNEKQTGPTARAGKSTIAILPFANMSGDPEQEYFADGMTEDIITDLSRFRDYLVIARNSTFVYKGKATNIPTVARELGADYLVEGSVRRAGERLRTTVQLIEARTGTHLWAERYDRQMGDLFQLQDEIVENIVRAVAERLRIASEDRASRKPPQNLEAYDYVLRARSIIVDNREKLGECRALYEAALAVDPDCAAACLGLAVNYLFEFTSGWADMAKGGLDRALEYARRAAALDDLDSAAQRLLGLIHLFRHEPDDALQHLDMALTLNPNDADALAYRALYLVYERRAADGLAEMDRATRRNPFHPNFYYWYIGLALYSAGRYGEAVAPLRKAIYAQPKFVTPHRHLAACYVQLGQLDDARLEASKILELDPDFSISKLAQLLAYRNPEDLAHYCDALRKAGLPD